MALTEEYVDNTIMHRFTFYENFAGQSQINANLNPAKFARFDELRVHCSAAHSAEDLVITLVPGRGSGYSVLIASIGLNGITDLIFHPSQPFEFLSDDQISFALTNSAEGTVTLDIKGWAVIA